jgi:hypothetical protein
VKFHYLVNFNWLTRFIEHTILIDIFVNAKGYFLSIEKQEKIINLCILEFCYIHSYVNILFTIITNDETFMFPIRFYSSRAYLCLAENTKRSRNINIKSIVSLSKY